MGMASGTQPLPFGHSADAAVDIEGLSVRELLYKVLKIDHLVKQLLEDHFNKLREEDEDVDMDEAGDAGWENWDVESDSSDSDEESEGWIDVDDADDQLVISDSEDEGEKKDGENAKAGDKNSEDLATRVSTLATTKVISFSSKIC